MLNVKKIKQDFPIFERTVNAMPLVYLDSAATTQKPWQVCEEMDVYYCHSNANVHRGIYTLAEESTEMYEGARETVRGFIGAAEAAEIVFVRNATEGLNLLAQSYAMPRLKAGDRIVVTEMEHHANLLPWQRVAKQTGAELVFIPVNETGQLIDSWAEYITANTKIVSFCHISNLLGTVVPAKELIKAAHAVGAVVIMDAAQSVPHQPINVGALDVDFMVFSGHKMLGPTGIGVLYGKRQWLESMEPYMLGGEMIREVSYESASWQDLPWKFEAGTPNIAGAVGLAKAIGYLEKIGLNRIHNHESQLTKYALDALQQMDGITLYGPLDAVQRGGIATFNVDGVHAHDVASLLDEDGVAVRAGHHCVQPMVRKMGLAATVRASFYVYNDTDDIDVLVRSLQHVQKVFKK